jgi:flagellar protein FliO/FliZ
MNAPRTDAWGGKPLDDVRLPPPGTGAGQRRLSVAFAALAALATAAFAADDNKILFPAASAPAAAPAGGSLGNVSLVVGLALAAVGGWFVWRGRTATARSADDRALAIEETRSLGNRQYLVVASYQEKRFLLGVCPGRIELLAPLPGEKPRG